MNNSNLKWKFRVFPCTFASADHKKAMQKRNFLHYLWCSVKLDDLMINILSEREWWSMIDWWSIFEGWQARRMEKKCLQLSSVNIEIEEKSLNRWRSETFVSIVWQETENFIISLSSALSVAKAKEEEGESRSKREAEAQKPELINLIWWFTDVAFEIITGRAGAWCLLCSTYSQRK